MSNADSKRTGSFSLRILRPAEKELRRLPGNVITRIKQRLDLLELDPYPSQSQKLSGGDNGFRLRVGDYRVLYRIDQDSKMIFVYRIAHRQGAYH